MKVATLAILFFAMMVKAEEEVRQDEAIINLPQAATGFGEREGRAPIATAPDAEPCFG